MKKSHGLIIAHIYAIHGISSYIFVLNLGCMLILWLTLLPLSVRFDFHASGPFLPVSAWALSGFLPQSNDMHNCPQGWIWVCVCVSIYQPCDTLVTCTGCTLACISCDWFHIPPPPHSPHLHTTLHMSSIQTMEGRATDSDFLILVICSYREIWTSSAAVKI